MYDHSVRVLKVDAFFQQPTDSLVRGCTCVYVHVYVCILVRVRVCTCVCMCVCARVQEEDEESTRDNMYIHA